MYVTDWSPADGYELEPSALKAVTSNENYYVTAGPGAGKTELLAQRASYLLETNTCNHPRKILAISFKKDAAKNLAERVLRRCGSELAQRFVSQTYDAFAKSLLDHFLKALPQAYQPAKNYDVITDTKFIIKVFESVGFNSTKGSQSSVFINALVSQKLPLDTKNLDRLSTVVATVWEILLKGGGGFSPGITFPMIARLSVRWTGLSRPFFPIS